MKKIFLIIFFVSLLIPLISLAGTYQADGGNVCYEGLVPCGKPVNIGGSWEDGHCVGGDIQCVRCQFCHLFVMLNAIIYFVLFQIVPPIAALMLVIGGIMFMFANLGEGGPQMLNQARKLISSVIIGLIIMFSAWLVVGVFFSFIGVAEWTGLQAGWFNINCPVKLDSYPCPIE